MTDYWLSKLLYDLHQSAPMIDEYRTDRDAVLDRYPLTPEVRAALLANDVAFIAARVNPYLLRYYFASIGMSDMDFMERMRASGAAASAHG